MSETGKLHQSDETPESTNRGWSQILADQHPHQEGDGPTKWGRLRDQTTSSPDFSDFLLRVSSINGLDSTRYIGGKNRKGS
ncbi:hypothetical protein KXV92_003634 [Aspergillus fumigatus]|nr:hypothetical protein KXX42_003269 [Aspergillus fumigatus]KAH1552547.1 hypothetical protein KXX57_007589 [Aspergillus fumigatus]KAH1980048.1 hypothetical protein KXW88_006891 [Aspergillus fumigatus]KAH2312049.1 hypothetical protein KXV47_004179 [Aspergillus fumigatus]KAH2669881.1 hypothetical protein KXV32_003952 [Aspergillus fumigatus]